MILENKIKNFPYKIILGSASPRRKELLSGLGFEFTQTSINADESFSDELRDEQIPIYLAEKKAKEYAKSLAENELLITADTVVVCNSKIYNKPLDADDAKKMLQELSGKMHKVFTAVCLRTSNTTQTFFDETKVYFKNFTEEEIEFYIHKFKPYDKAGAYGVQEWLGYIGIEKIEGNFYNVMGLPVHMVFEALMMLKA